MTIHLISWLSDDCADMADDVVQIRSDYQQGIRIGTVLYFNLPELNNCLKALGCDDMPGISFVNVSGVVPGDCRGIIRRTRNAAEAVKAENVVCFNTHTGNIFCRTACLMMAQTTPNSRLVDAGGVVVGPDKSSSLATYFMSKWLSTEQGPGSESRHNSEDTYVGGRLHDVDLQVAEHPQPYNSMVYKSQAMSNLVGEALKAAKCDYPVLIEGESGTGKEMMAKFVHGNSFRADKCFMPVNCGAIPDSLAEAEFFGYRKGAFTGAVAESKGYFEAADSGTLFMDEVGELPRALQVRLLRVLQEKQVTRVGARNSVDVDVRIISATNKDLIAETGNGRFREDLYHRLGVLVLKLPPLRERKEDIIPLAEHFSRQINSELSQQNSAYMPKQLTAECCLSLEAHCWPGNVRELRNTLLRAFILSDSEQIGAEEISLVLLRDTSLSSEVFDRTISDGFSLDHAIDQLAMHYLQLAMEMTGGKKGPAARLLGFDSRQRMNTWLKKYDMHEG